MVSRYSHGSLLPNTVSIDCESGAMIIDQRVFVFPDHETALLGEFHDSVLVSAHQASVQNISVNRDFLLSVQCGKCFGPEYIYSPSGGNFRNFFTESMY